jgi:peptide chain release factor 2
LLPTIFDPPKLKESLNELTKLTQDEAFWQNQKEALKVNKKIAFVTKSLTELEKLQKEVNYLEELLELIKQEPEDELEASFIESLNSLYRASENAYIQTLLSGEYDKNNAILTLHAGAGGTEAQDWAQMLYRMYARFAERSGFSITVLDYLEGDTAGLKSVQFLVAGENAYGYLKCEKGVHRLVRISPFDSGARRHTSFASLDVMPEIEEDTNLQIKPDELRIDTYRASGAGGQHVNTTDSAVRITHLPTGVVVTCQNERSQIQNRETAMKLLLSELAKLKEEQHAEKLSDIKGETKKIEWGSQIRSYVFHPYNMVKDHRTSFETSNTSAVMDGDLQPFIDEFLKKSGAKNEL